MPFDATVQAAQRKLNDWWEVKPKLNPDGIFGANTARAARQFQERVGLPITGQLDAATLQRLGVAAVWNMRDASAPIIAAQKSQQSLTAFINSLDPFNPQYAPLRQQAVALQQVAQQTANRAQQATQTGAQPDAALLAQIAQLQAAVTQLTGKAPNSGSPDMSKWLLYGGIALFAVMLLTPRD